MAQGRGGRAVPVKWAHEKDQSPTMESSGGREGGRGGREQQGGGEMSQTSTLERWDEGNP